MERITRFRALAMLLVFALLLSVFSIRMYAMQILGAGDVVESSSSYTSYYTVKAARGDILDRNGNKLVSNRASYNLVFNNFVLTSSDDPNGHLLRLVQLCRELGIEYTERFPITEQRPYEYTLDEQSTSWQGYFQDYLSYMAIDSDVSAPRLIRMLRDTYRIPDDWSDLDARKVIGLRYELMLRTDITNLSAYVFIEDVSDEDLNAIMELNVPGLDAEATTVREYNTSYMAHILGYLTQINAEDWPEYDEKGYSMDAYVGADGLEKAFEEELHGTDGQLARTVDKNGNIISERYTLLPVAGNNVETTLDLELQMVAEDSLAECIENLKAGILNDGNTGKDVQGAAVVVVEVKTGQILAIASYPTYNLATFREDYNDILEMEDDPLFNRALLGTYAPGSVYKMATTIAGIESGVIDGDSQITTKGIYTKYDDVQPTCLVYSRSNGRQVHGTIDVTEALNVSCNYFFYEVGDRLSIDTLDDVARNLGLGEPTGIELYEYVGSRANPETKDEKYVGTAGLWYPADQILAAIGQSENAFTPIQLASYTATLANEGTRYALTLLSRVVSSDYSQLVEENAPEVISTMEISDEAVAAYKSGMNKVTHTGTAWSYFAVGADAWYNMYDIEVCAKTGTAEHGMGGSPHGSFVCFAPMDDPEIAICVYGEKAGVGGYLGNVAIDVMEAYFSADTASDIVTYENRVS